MAYWFKVYLFQFVFYEYHDHKYVSYDSYNSIRRLS
jgi:hypothetical protein